MASGDFESGAPALQPWAARGVEVPPPGLVSTRQPVWGSWHSTLPVPTLQVSLGAQLAARGRGFYDINAKLASFLRGNSPGAF